MKFLPRSLQARAVVHDPIKGSRTKLETSLPAFIATVINFSGNTAMWEFELLCVLIDHTHLLFLPSLFHWVKRLNPHLG